MKNEYLKLAVAGAIGFYLGKVMTEKKLALQAQTSAALSSSMQTLATQNATAQVLPAINTAQTKEALPITETLLTIPPPVTDDTQEVYAQGQQTNSGLYPANWTGPGDVSNQTQESNLSPEINQTVLY